MHTYVSVAWIVASRRVARVARVAAVPPSPPPRHGSMNNGIPPQDEIHSHAVAKFPLAQPASLCLPHEQCRRIDEKSIERVEFQNSRKPARLA